MKKTLIILTTILVVGCQSVNNSYNFDTVTGNIKVNGKSEGKIDKQVTTEAINPDIKTDLKADGNQVDVTPI